MSYRIHSEAFESSASKGTALLVLLALAVFADESGRCFPSIVLIAGLTNLSQRRVRRALDDLVTAGELLIELHPATDAGPLRARSYIVRPPATRARLAAQPQGAPR